MFRSLASLVAVMVFSTFSVLAAPTISLTGGSTTVTLSRDLAGAATALGLSVRPVFPGRVSPAGRVGFPVTSGDLDPQNARGEILHAGGSSIAHQTATVKLMSFIIDTTGEQPVLTGLAQANGNVGARIKLFKLRLPPL